MQKISFFFLLLLACTAQAQILPIKQDGKWGAIDAQGRPVIAPQYEFIGEFDSLGWATFKKDGLVGILTDKGQALIPPQYEQARVLSPEYIAVWQKGLCGVVNTKHEMLVKPVFERVDMLGNRFFKVTSEQKSGICNTQGEAVLAGTHTRISLMGEEGGTTYLLEKAGKFGLAILPAAGAPKFWEAVYDKVYLQNGKVLAHKGPSITEITLSEQGDFASEQAYTNATAYNMAQEKARRQDILSKEADPKKPRWQQDGFHYKLTDALGNNLLGNRTFYVLNEDEKLGLAMGISENAEKKTECWVIDPKKGKEVFHILAKDLVLGDFNDSRFARITIDTLYDGLVDMKGNIVAQINGQEITAIGNFNDGRAAVQCGSTFGFIDGDANVAIPLEYDIASSFEKGHAVAKKAGLFGLLNTQGKAVVPFAYDGVSLPEEGIVRVKKGKGSAGKWGLMNLQGQMLADFQYTIISPIVKGEAVVRQGGKLGVIDTKGNVLVPVAVLADNMEPFSKGLAKIGKERIVENIAGRPEIRYKYQGYVDRKGNVVVPMQYEFIYDFDSIWAAKRGLAKVVNNNLIGFINHLGEEVVPPQYSDIEGFEEVYMQGTGLAKIRKGDKFGYINASGKVVLEPAYSSVEGFERVLADTNLLALASIDGKFGYINHKEKPLVLMQYERLSPIFNGSIIAKKGGKYGLINTKEEVLIPFEYDGIRFLEGSQALLTLYKKSNAYIVFDGNGQVIRTVEAGTPPAQGVKLPKYKYLTAFDAQGLAIVEEEGLKGIADQQGKLVLKPKYKDIKPFSDGFAAVWVDSKDKEKRKWGFVNAKGEEVVEPRFTAVGAFGNGKAPATEGRLWGYIDASGSWKLNPQYRQAEAFSGGYAIVNQREIINEKGEKVGSFDMEGTILDGFSAERAVVEVKSGQTHIMPNGEPAYFRTYDEATPFLGDVAFVKKGEKWELLRQAGPNQTKVPFTKYGKAQYLKQYGGKDKKQPKYGPAIVDLSWEKVSDGRWRMIDRQGNFLGETVYEALRYDLQTNTFEAHLEGTFGLADLSGKMILPPVQEMIKPAAPGIVRIEHEGKIGYLLPNGSWIWEMSK